MTADGAAGGRPARDTTRRRSDADPAGARRGAEGLGLVETLAVCDKLIGEPGRRGHLFAWLRAPGAGAENWLPVDAYYPRSRIVVLYRSGPGAHDDLYRKHIPQHGLRLLELGPMDLGSTHAGAERALQRMLATLPPLPSAEPAAPRTPRWRAGALRRQDGGERRAVAGRPNPVARRPGPAAAAPQTTTGAPQTATGAPQTATAMPQSAPVTLSAVERGSRFVTARRGKRPARGRESPLPGIIVGLALVLLLVVAVIYVASAVGG